MSSPLLTREQLAQQNVRLGFRSCGWCFRFFTPDWKTAIPRPPKLQAGMISTGMCPDCLGDIGELYKPQSTK